MFMYLMYLLRNKTLELELEFDIENQILVKIKLKHDTRLQKNIEQSSIFFLQPW